MLLTHRLDYVTRPAKSWTPAHSIAADLNAQNAKNAGSGCVLSDIELDSKRH